MPAACSTLCAFKPWAVSAAATGLTKWIEIVPFSAAVCCWTADKVLLIGKWRF
jgi:hypothetical protein